MVASPDNSAVTKVSEGTAMFPRVSSSAVFLAAISICLADAASAGGIGISTDAEPDTFAATSITFYPYRPGEAGTIPHRDLELMWDTQYGTGLTATIKKVLDKLGYTISDSLKNPFGASLSDMHLNYEYFRIAPNTYTTNPFDSTGLRLGSESRFPPCPPNCPQAWINLDRSHADWYIYSPSRGINYGQYPSGFQTDDEDVSSGRAIGDVRHGNSVMTMGPSGSAIYDTTGVGWTRPDAQSNVFGMHEIQHSLPLQPFGMLTELFSAGAEAIGGNQDTTAIFETPYTWSLLGYFAGGACGSPSPTCVRSVSSNYQGRSLFAAYLAFNFRGADTSVTLGGFNDDLMHRWARSGRKFTDLVNLLGNDSCGTCAGKSYFHPGGTPLLNYDRLQLLLHNWRVANYVNNSALAEGQYGFPPQNGFSPAKQVKAWQDFDGYGTDDLVAEPPVVILDQSQATRETTLVGWRSFRSNTYPLRLQPLGSEYWIVRADTASLGSAARDLVVRVTPEAIHRCGTPQRDGRLVASVVAYTWRDPDAVESPQWNHPEWARVDSLMQPRWVDVDSVAGDLQFVVRGFGTTYKAAVVVLSLGDGPSRYYESVFGLGYEEALPYRLSLSLRSAPFDSLSPRWISRRVGEPDDHPAWSPAGDEIAHEALVPSQSSLQQIYRRDAYGGSPSPVSPAASTQRSPDWSPRGDWIAFQQDSAAASWQDIWAKNLNGGELRRLTFWPGVEASPSFQPNGQALAYTRSPVVIGNQVFDTWELRRVNLDGTGDMAVVSPGTPDEIRSIRWSPDGALIYFTRNDSLFAASKDGGEPIPRTSLLARVTSFDFHPGNGRIAVEEPGTARSIACSVTPAIPFRRLALVDTTSGARDTLERFYRTGVEPLVVRRHASRLERRRQRRRRPRPVRRPGELQPSAQVLLAAARHDARAAVPALHLRLRPERERSGR